jgi:ribosomal protein S18 acetylase RimI-like enzyme
MEIGTTQYTQNNYTLFSYSSLLDTLSSMQSAISLYRKIGFVDIDSYYNNPNDDIVYLGLYLSNK